MSTYFSRLLLQLLAAGVVVFYVYIFWTFNRENSVTKNFEDLKWEVEQLERHLKDSESNVEKIRQELSAQQAIYGRLISKDDSIRVQPRHRGERLRPDVVGKQVINAVKSGGAWPEPIPVLVFACHRAVALDNHLKKLLKYRTSAEKFPIIVSQDCDDNQVADVARNLAKSVRYVKHLSGEKANVTAAPNMGRYLTYYMIARHYKLGLSYVFDTLGYKSVIITEDDLDIAPDFFDYFSATRYLLERDRTLYCVSAWNDNGKPNLIDTSAYDLLHRSDFFPGLGWMMTSELWQELGPIWPTGFWDDWIRDPARRNNRSCIRPEISRTAMTPEGKKGASNGLFFVNHLNKIVLNTKPVNFTLLNLDYLLKENYDEHFIEHVYSTPLLPFSKLRARIARGVGNKSREYRIEYDRLERYLDIAKQLQIMGDFKAGVPRTAYLGVVACYVNNIRIFVAPDRRTWKGYNTTWEAPESIVNSVHES